jgi:hypothetical protein
MNPNLDGLFGPSPEMIGRQQYEMMRARAAQEAQMSNIDRANYGMRTAGATLGHVGAGMLGSGNPAIEEAKMRESVMGMGGDLTTSAGLKAKAMQFDQAGDKLTAMKLLIAARQMEAQDQEMSLKRAQELSALHKANSESSPFAKINPKEYTPESVAKYVQTRNPADLVAADGGEKQPSAVQEYLYAKKEGYKGSFEDWKKSQKVEGTKVVLPTQENAFEKELGGGQAKELMEGRKLADDAVQMLQTNKIGRQILDKGMVTGFGANAIVGIGQALKQAGINFGGDATANAQAYTSVMAQNVGKLIKQFGSGTGLSDADREYATKMAAGSISVDEAAIRKVIDINDRAARNVIALHNKRAGKVKTNVPLTVDIPEESGSDLAAAAKAELERRGGKK